MTQKYKKEFVPLATRMRPRNFEEFVGQEEIIGKGRTLRKLIDNDNVPSLILWGPPGSSKTTLSYIIATKTSSYFERVSAVSSGIPDLKKIVKAAKARLLSFQQKTILFIDEIHRFSKTQQDFLLPYVEDGTVVFIGATTENPSFEVISPLLSRSRIFVMKPLSDTQIEIILKRALKDKGKGLGNFKVNFDKKAWDFLVKAAGGDARRALNTLEIAVLSSVSKKGRIRSIFVRQVEEALQKKYLKYDKKGEDHYNTISAFIKSLRGSDPDAALFYLVRMLESGEDPLFIVRRMVIFASEDISNADPFALVLAVACKEAVEFVGLPECQINLAHLATYLASCEKSNASYLGLLAAKKEIQSESYKSTPLHLRNAVTSLAKDLDYGKGYKYPHDFKGHFVKERYLPEGNKGGYFCPTDIGFEKKIKKRLEEIWGRDD